MSSEYKPFLTPVYVAASLAGVFFIRVHMTTNNGGDSLIQACATPPASRLSLYTLPYLPEPVSGFLCILSEFFLTALEPNTAAWRTVYECLGSLAVPAAAGWLEASRGNRSLWLAAPWLWGIAYQTLGGGIIIPLQMLAIILTADEPKRIRQGQIARADAEGALLGLLLGYVAPSLYLALRPDSLIAAVWQAFPIYISIIKVFYSTLRRLVTRKGATLDGYWATQVTYGICGLLGLASHLRVVYSIISSVNFIGELQSMFLPSIFNLPPGSSTNAAAWHMLKWDNALMFGSCLVAALWLSIELGKGLEGPTTIAFVQGIPAFGPGPVMAAAWIWREKGLREMRRDLDKLEKEEAEKELNKGNVEAKAIKASAVESDAGSGVETPLKRSKKSKTKPKRLD